MKSESLRIIKLSLLQGQFLIYSNIAFVWRFATEKLKNGKFKSWCMGNDSEIFRRYCELKQRSVDERLDDLRKVVKGNPLLEAYTRSISQDFKEITSVGTRQIEDYESREPTYIPEENQTPEFYAQRINEISHYVEKLAKDLEDEVPDKLFDPMRQALREMASGPVEPEFLMQFDSYFSNIRKDLAKIKMQLEVHREIPMINNPFDDIEENLRDVEEHFGRVREYVMPARTAAKEKKQSN